MRYELSDYEWSVIKPMLPNKPRGVPRVDDCRVLNGIFWVSRLGAPWRDLPENYGPHTTCYNASFADRQGSGSDRMAWRRLTMPANDCAGRSWRRCRLDQAVRPGARRGAGNRRAVCRTIDSAI